ncbi:hypothetical protein FVE85_8899 [Porphyridium purpureum]|uniref:Uncharacterized protein n=1 Tax=Porphyridium purpureum TaxID=35688 RepID=A0A5J4YRY6_PORPP|nr:hypothetical protein FVE85_8899 [Porphyridium purpureum]|eukprot:POR1350..scf296_7
MNVVAVRRLCASVWRCTHAAEVRANVGPSGVVAAHREIRSFAFFTAMKHGIDTAVHVGIGQMLRRVAHPLRSAYGAPLGYAAGSATEYYGARALHYKARRKREKLAKRNESRAPRKLPRKSFDPDKFNANTRRLNNRLRYVLEKKDGCMRRLRRVLAERGCAPYDEWTVSFLLRIARKTHDVPGSVRLQLAIRALQRARADRAALDDQKVLLLIPLARLAGYKVNILRAVVRYMQTERQHTFSRVVYRHLAVYFGQCGRHELMLQTVSEMRALHGHSMHMPETFLELMRHFLMLDLPDCAWRVWRSLRATPLEIKRILSKPLLEAGAKTCHLTSARLVHLDKDAAGSNQEGADEITNEARWIMRVYDKNRTVPSKEVLFALASVLIRGGCLEEARTHMLRTIEMRNVLHANLIYEYLEICADRGASSELLPLCQIVTAARNIGFNLRDRVPLLRDYLHTLYLRVRFADGSELEPKLVAESAQKVFFYWRLEDPLMASYVVYMSACTGQLSLALRIADTCHHEHGSKSANRILRSFAYEALVEQSVQDGEDAIDRAVQLVLSNEPVDMVDPHVAAFAASVYIHTFARVGRFDLSTKVFKTFCARTFAADMDVCSAYLYELGMAGQLADAVGIFRTLYARRQRRPLGYMTYSALAATLLRNAYSPQLSAALLAELLDILQRYVAVKNRPELRPCEADLDIIICRGFPLKGDRTEPIRDEAALRDRRKSENIRKLQAQVRELQDVLAARR